MNTQDLLKNVFGGNGKLPAPPAPPPIKLPRKPKRYIPDIAVAIQAQRIYNPDNPPAPATRPAPKGMSEQGTAASMATEGETWGNPANG